MSATERSVAQHHLLLYEYVEDVVERRGPHREAHLAHVRSAGGVLMAGAFGDPPSGAVFVFRGVERAAVEAFAAADPYGAAGLVTASRIEPWNVVVGGELG